MPNALTPVEVQTVVPKINTEESLNKTLTHCVTCDRNGIHGKYKKSAIFRLQEFTFLSPSCRQRT